MPKLRNMFQYLIKFLRHGSFRDLSIILKYVPVENRKNALLSYLHQQSLHLKFNYQLGEHDLWFFLHLLKCKKRRVAKNLYLWQYQGKNVYASDHQFFGLHAEYLAGVFSDIYDFDWKGKQVLDVGGFVGDSARYFLESGAQRVFVYEPIAENVQALRYNLKHFKNKFEVYQEAIAHKEGLITLTSSEPLGSLGFGADAGQYSATCQGTTIFNVLARHSIDVAKIDCEGGEQYLVEVPNRIIQSIPYWMVETHNADIYAKVSHKFQECGFTIKKDLPLSPTVNLLHFVKSC